MKLTEFARCRATCLVAIVVTMSEGCSSGRIPICGEVTLDGKPIEQGTITMEPADGKGKSAGGEIVNGKYQLVGEAAPSLGKKIVRIYAVHKTGRRVRDGFSATGRMLEESVPCIPDIYNAQSILTCEVVAGRPNQDFRLKSQ